MKSGVIRNSLLAVAIQLSDVSAGEGEGEDEGEGEGEGEGKGEGEGEGVRERLSNDLSKYAP